MRPYHSVSIGTGYDIQAHLISEVGPQERRPVTDSDADAFFNTLQAKLLRLRKHSSSYAQSRVRRCDQLIAADTLSVAPRHAIQQLIKAHCARDQGEPGVHTNGSRRAVWLASNRAAYVSDQLIA